MLIRGELILVLVGLVLAVIAIASVFSGRLARWRTPFAAVACLMAGLAPLLLYPSVDLSRARGTALWEWSAVGGPTIQASYRLDGLAALGLAIAVLYGGAALIATTRVAARSALLRPALLLNAFILVTLVVTNDLVADTVVLGALASTTIFIALLVAPPSAVARITAYLAAGVQAFIVAGLLITRFGAASFRFDAIAPTSISPGVVLAAAVGGALFAGLYPFVPWGYRQEAGGERESLRGLLTMPAGVGATIVLVRLLGVTRIDLSEMVLPGLPPTWLLPFTAALAAVTLWRTWRGHARGRRGALVALVALALVLLYPYLHWSHLVVVACLLTVAYAAAVSLALPDHWPVTRYDVTLAAAWVGLAVGTPVSVAGALIVLLGGAVAALGEAVWMPPHRGYIAMFASTTTIITGGVAVFIGALATPDPVTLVLGSVAILSAVALELVHVGRRLDVAAAPADLEVTATVVALLASTLVTILAALPMLDALATAVGRPMDRDLGTLTFMTAAIAVLAALLGVLAGAIRPLLPDLAPVGASLGRVVIAADPVPLAMASFGTLERAATVVSTAFNLFEQRAGVWLAIVLIGGVLVWAVR